MSVLSDLGLATAGRLRARLGARTALRMLAPMIASNEPSLARGRAIVIAMECAIELGDDPALEELTLFWTAEPAPATSREIAGLVAGALASGRPDRAMVIAEAEVKRRGSATALTLRAIAEERSGRSERAVETWREAVGRTSDVRVAGAARIELVRVLGSRASSKIEAAKIASTFGSAALSTRSRLVLARAQLGESGRYARVKALDTLIELAADTDQSIARAAVRAAAAHADDAGGAITPIELERVRSALALWPDEPDRGRALRMLDAVADASAGDAAARSAGLVRAAAIDTETRGALDRARAILSGDAPGPRGGTSWAALAAVAAIRRGRDDEARDRLRELVAEGERAATAPAWTAAWLGLDRPALRDHALALARVLLATLGTPPRGFSHLATHLERAGAHADARRALARAHEAREPGARERRIEALVRAGWDAARTTRRDEGIALLREAKEAAEA